MEATTSQATRMQWKTSGMEDNKMQWKTTECNGRRRTATEDETDAKGTAYLRILPKIEGTLAYHSVK